MVSLVRFKSGVVDQSLGRLTGICIVCECWIIIGSRNLCHWEYRKNDTT